VLPLAVPEPDCPPSPDSLVGYPAVRLFVERARAVDPTFVLTPETGPAVVAVCQRLDGLPLAIELAAARTKLLSPPAMLPRLARRLPLLVGGPRDVPARLQTMRAAIAWGHDLLPPDVQVLFRRLAVFAGGFTLEAAEAVAQGTGDDSSEVVDGVAALVDASLLRRLDGAGAAPRLTMLETIREYALEQLAASGEGPEVHRAHATYFLRLAEAVEDGRTGSGRPMSSVSLGVERANLRAALGWLRDHGDVRGALRLGGALWPLWLDLGEIAEGRLQLASSLALPGASEDRVAWAKASAVLGALAQAQGDHNQAIRFSNEALAAFQERSDARGAACALTTLGLDAMVQGEYDRATRLLDRAWLRFRGVGDPRAGTWALRHLATVAIRRGDIVRAQALAEDGLDVARAAGTDLDIARLLHTLGVATAVRGDVARATKLWEESLALYRRTENEWGVADALASLGDVAHEGGDPGRAIALLEDSLGRFRRIGDPEGTAFLLSRLARARRTTGDVDAAIRDLQEGLALARQHNTKSSAIACLLILGAVALDRGDQGQAEAAWGEALTLATDVGDRRAAAAGIEWCAHLAAARGRVWSGATLLGAAEALRAALDTPTPPADRAEHDVLRARLRGRLGDASFAVAWATGRALGLEAAVAEARAAMAQATPPAAPRSDPRDWTLTAREREVLGLLVAGRTDKQIAETLLVSMRTATTHVTHILAKLGVANRTEAATIALRLGLVERGQWIPGHDAVEEWSV
jgi:predicted ATPase/DNA-binding CsgD family transcriptional regulator